MLTNTRTILVEWGDCDPLGIVFYPRYFAWFDASTIALFAAGGLPKPVLLKTYKIVGFPLVDARARFIIPSRYDDEVRIESAITEFGRSSFQVRHQLFRGDELAVEAFEKRVCVAHDEEDPGRLKSAPIPAEVVEMFSR